MDKMPAKQTWVPESRYPVSSNLGKVAHVCTPCWEGLFRNKQTPGLASLAKILNDTTYAEIINNNNNVEHCKTH